MDDDHLAGAKAAFDLRIQALKDSIGKRLRQARTETGLTLDQVAETMFRSKANIGHWETGRNHISAAELAFLAIHYGRDGHWLLTGEQRSALGADAVRAFAAFQALPADDRRYIAEMIEDRKRRAESAGSGAGNRAA